VVRFYENEAKRMNTIGDPLIGEGREAFCEKKKHRNRIQQPSYITVVIFFYG
jgi:hypothetical protein